MIIFIGFLISFLSGILIGHVCTKKFDSIALTEEEVNKWFKKGFLAGCAETVDVVIKHRLEVEKAKEQSK